MSENGKQKTHESIDADVKDGNDKFVATWASGGAGEKVKIAATVCTLKHDTVSWYVFSLGQMLQQRLEGNATTGDILLEALATSQRASANQLNGDALELQPAESKNELLGCILEVIDIAGNRSMDKQMVEESKQPEE